MEINTKIGTIVVEDNESEDYPGINMLIRLNGIKIPLAMIEVDQSDEDDIKFGAYMYSPDINRDEPVITYKVLAQEIMNACYEN